MRKEHYMKQPERRYIGAVNKAKGRRFEERLDIAFEYARVKGYALIEKTPEPMRPVKRLDNGKFVAVYEHSAQPDYKGVLAGGGKCVVLEAKYTSTDRIDQTRITRNQAEALERYSRFGALCYVIVGFGSGNVYVVRWETWARMKEAFGRKYVTEADLESRKVPESGGVLDIFGMSY